MHLLPIDKEEKNNLSFYKDPECIEVLKVFTNHYKKVGFNKPWIAYFIADENSNIIGGGGFKGQPLQGKVEISYGTFKKYESRGVGTAICKQLVLLALKTDPSVKITARTLPDNLSSIKVLKKNGFVCLGNIYDEEDGDVLEWEFAKL